MNHQDYTPKPPQWADRLLEWLCAPHALEEIQGDLHEIYAHRVKNSGEEIARQRYFTDMLGFIWRYGINRRRSPHSIQTHSTPIFMFSHYLLTALRQLRRQPGISLSYITGLTLGIASSLIIFLIVKQENSYDTYHANGDRIYRVETLRMKEQQTLAGIPDGALLPLRQEFKEIEKVVPIKVEHGQLVSVVDANEQAKFKEKIAFTEKDIFQLLDFRWLAGNQATALTEPYTAVLSESYAQKFFGSIHQAVGKTILLNNKQELLITGVMADYPDNTDFTFDILCAYATLKSMNPDATFNDWGSIGDNHQTFILLQKGVQPAALESLFPALIKKHMNKESAKETAFTLLPLQKIHFAHNFRGRSADLTLLQILFWIGIFILALACINFINLATAQGTKRAKEVGVRKVLGSNRLQLIYQFLTEAGIITFLSMLLAVGIAYMSLNSVTQLFDITIANKTFFSFSTLAFLLSVFAATSILAGLYPAFVLSGFAPVKAIKQSVTGRFSRKIIFRNSLVVFQFSISLLLIIGTFIVAQQLNLFRKAYLGFNKEAILTVEIPDNTPAKLQILRQQLLQSPQIQQVSFSLNSASAESNWMQATHYKTDREEVIIRTQMKWVDANFIDTYGIQLVAGEVLEEGDSLSKILINETYLQRMHLSNPQEALGKLIYGINEQPLSIAGVVKNFNVNSLHQKIDPTIMAVVPKYFFQGSIKLHQAGITTENLENTITHVQKAWSTAFPEHIFGYQFLDETLEKAYRKEIQTAKMASIATTIAIVISCLGLFGLAVFTAQQRIKEIGIRKVLGASTIHILALFSKDFLKLVLLANIFAWPVAWWYMNKWLQNFEFRITISPWVFVLAALAACVLTLLTISYQSVKAALANPVNSLRNN